MNPINTSIPDFPNFNANITRLNCNVLREPDLFFVFLSLTLLLVSSASIFFNYIFLTLLRQTAIFHQNVCSLLVNAELGTSLASGCLILRSTFYHWSISALGYDYLKLHSTHCAMLECLYVMGVVTMMLSLVGIGIERLCATWRWAPKKATYNASKDPPSTVVGSKRRRTLPTLTRQTSELIATTDRSGIHRTGPFVKAFIIGTWFYGVCNIALFYWSAKNLDQTLCYCQLALAITEDVLYGTMAVWLGLAIFTLLLYCTVLSRNRRHLLDFTINTARHNLQERFLAWHNITITAMLLPAVITNAVLSGAFFIALMPIYGWYNDFRHSTNSILALASILHIFAASMLLHPILTTRACEKLRAVACKQYPRLKWLWSAGQAGSSGKFSTTSMRGITMAEFHVQNDTAGNSELTEPASAKKKVSDSVIVDYRIDPDQHRQLIERLWSMKD